MSHFNKNILVSLHFQEASEQEEHLARNHLATCEKCREYMQFLSQMDASLDHWQDEKPKPKTLDLILENIPAEKVRVINFRPVISPAPIFKIAFSVFSILLFIYLAQSKIAMLPIWTHLQEYWLIQTIGSFGFVMLAFFCIGTFFTLSLAPMLYFNYHKKAFHF